MDISVTGSAAKMGLLAKLSLDLEPLRKGMAPFLSPPPPEMSGRINVELEASGDGTNFKEQIRYDLKVDGSALRASGGALEKRAMGPLRFGLTNAGIFNQNKLLLDIHKGIIHVQDGSDIFFHGVVSGFKNPPLTANLIADSIVLNLEELISLAGPFVPPGISLDHGKENKAGPPKLEIRNAAFTGTVPTGSSHLTWDSLELAMPFLESSLPGASATVEGLHLQVGKGDVALAAFSPVRAEVTADVSMRAFHLKGKEPISLKDLHIPRFHLLANNLSPSPTAFFGLTGKIDVEQALSFENLSVSDRIHLSSFLQSLDVQLILPPSPSLSVTTFALSASSPSLRLKGLPSGPVTTPFKMKTTMEELTLSKDKPYRVDLKKGNVDLSAGKVMEAHLNVHMLDSGLKELQSDGMAVLDLAKASSLLPSSLRASALKGGQIGGRIDLLWNYIGRRPSPMEMERFLNKDIPLKDKLHSAVFLETAEIQTKLTNIRLDIPFGEKRGIKGRQDHHPGTLNSFFGKRD